MLAVLLGLLALLARWSLRKDQVQTRATAEQIAALIAGQLASSSQEDGDRFSLKESNSIKSLIAEAVLALNARNTRPAAAGHRQAQIGEEPPAIHGDVGRELRESRARRGWALLRATPPRRSAIEAHSFCRRICKGR